MESFAMSARTSTQTPREIVYNALHFKTPSRMPVRMGSVGVDDTRWITRRTAERGLRDGLVVDEWGCAWDHTAEKNMGQVKGHPLSSVAEHDKAEVPDYNEAWRYEGLEQEFAQAEKDQRYTQTGIFMVLFERMHSLCGFENTLVGLLADPENAGALADRILQAQTTLVRNYQSRFGKRLHSFSMTDDWGTQQAAFVDMNLWNSFFLPRYRKLFSVMHEGGQDVWVHSCGKVNEVIQGFIDAGADAVNLQQPRALGIEEIGSRYLGKITFESLSDIQASLPSGDPRRIEADALALAGHWMLPSGGFVFSDYGDGEAIGAPLEAKRQMYQAFSRVSREVYGEALPALVG
jgi:uroporphyrinogen decarboxylase